MLSHHWPITQSRSMGMESIKSYSHKAALLQHMVMKHNGDWGNKKFVCEECGKSYTQKDALAMHVKKEAQWRSNTPFVWPVRHHLHSGLRKLHEISQQKQTLLSKVYLRILQLCYLLKFRIGETPELKSLTDPWKKLQSGENSARPLWTTTSRKTAGSLWSFT